MTTTVNSKVRKRIVSNEQLDTFAHSDTHEQIVQFVEALNESVVGVKLRDSPQESDVRLLLLLFKSHRLLTCHTQVVRSLVSVLDHIAEIAVQTPPVDNSKSRFGNPAFKTFYDRAQEVSHTRFCILRALTQTHSVHPACSGPSPVFQPARSQCSPPTFRNHGGIAQESTTEAAWSSTFSAFCEFFFFCISVVLGT
jgi:hypothetical protein